MKRFFILTMMLCACIMVVSAQTKKEQKAAAKALKQEVVRLTKEGWVVPAGKLPLSQQLSRLYTMQQEIDETGELKYLVAEGMSVGKSYDAAKMQALEVAKLRLAEIMQSEIAGIVDNELSNNQIEPEEAESITETVLSGKTLIQQSIGRVVPIVECYRTLPNKNKEVLVQIVYSGKQARSVSRDIVRKELKEKGQKLRDELDATMSKDK